MFAKVYLTEDEICEYVMKLGDEASIFDKSEVRTIYLTLFIYLFFTSFLKNKDDNLVLH